MRILLASLIIFMLSCNQNKKDIAALEEATLESVKKEIEKKRGVKEIISLKLVHKNGNEYSGILNYLNIWGKEQFSPIEVVYDGENIVWQIKK